MTWTILSNGEEILVDLLVENEVTCRVPKTGRALTGGGRPRIQSARLLWDRDPDNRDLVLLTMYLIYINLLLDPPTVISNGH